MADTTALNRAGTPAGAVVQWDAAAIAAEAAARGIACNAETAAKILQEASGEIVAAMRNAGWEVIAREIENDALEEYIFGTI